MTKPIDLPIIRFRFMSAAARAKARTAIVENGGLPAALERVACPDTRKWFGD